MKVKADQAGFSLIEIMIALLISAFLLSGIIQIFIGSKQTYKMQENLSRLQENGRLALNYLSSDIRLAGYWGCLSPISPNNIDVAGTNDNLGGGDNVDDGTDTITIKGSFVLTPNGTCGATVNSVNSCGTAKNCYTDTSSTISYTINNSVLQQGTNGQQNNLIDGIESMQIVYGVDTNEDRTANYYVPANNLTINDWSKVASVRISLLAATLDNNLTTQSLPYVFNDKTITPPGTDHKIRRVFTTTIALRNRLP